MKKGFISIIALAVFLSLGFGFSDTADAKRGGGFKSPKQSYTQKKDTGTQQSNTGATSTSGTKANTTGTATKSGGLFGGSGFMKGMMIGGLAGLLFGGMFGNMGAFGEILGLLVNVAAIVAIFMIIIAAFTYVRRKNTPAANGYQDKDKDRNNRGPY